MALSDKEIEIYESISFEEKYLKIMNAHAHDNYMSNPEKDEVLKVFESLNYKAKYFKSENFYAIREKTDTIYINFHVSVKTGGV